MLKTEVRVNLRANYYDIKKRAPVRNGVSIGVSSERHKLPCRTKQIPLKPVNRWR